MSAQTDPTFDALLGALVSHAHAGLPSATLQDTRANIIAASAATVRFAIATDTFEIFFANGSDWYLLPFKFYIEPAAPDMGAYQDNNRAGYYDDFITDKHLANVHVGGNSATEEGGIRWTGTYFQIYYGGQWNNAVIGFTFREASDGRLQIKPSGLTDWYDVFTGNSVGLGLNNLPITQQHNTHIGAFPAPQIVDGGGVTMDNPTTAYANQLINRTIHRILPRRMANAQRLALSQYETMAGEHVYETDTNDEYVSDGTGNWKKLT